jgi:hypothetical protein
VAGGGYYDDDDDDDGGGKRERERVAGRSRASSASRGWKMPPKKRDKEAELVGAVAAVAAQKQQPQAPTRMDQMQADHELFLQAFESEFTGRVHARCHYSSALFGAPSTATLSSSRAGERAAGVANGDPSGILGLRGRAHSESE